MLQSSWKALAAIVAAFGLAGGTAWAAPGDLDPTYGANGRVDLHIGPGVERFTKLLQQADGKLIAVGSLATTFAYFGASPPAYRLALARFNADGTRDASFGSGGLATSSLDLIDTLALDAVVQADGGIVVLTDCGRVTGVMPCLFRFLGDGTPDPAFTPPSDLPTRTPTRLALQADGKILLGVSGGIARLGADGRVDTTFGNQGTAASGAGAKARALAVGSDGSIVGVWEDSGPTTPYIRRFSSAGVRDTSYAPSISGANAFDAALLEPNGRLVVAGCTNGVGAQPSKLTVVRFAPNGFVDTSFNGTGVAQPADDYCGRAIERDASGRYVVVGAFRFYGTVAMDSSYYVARLKDDGTPDSTFSGGGVFAQPGSSQASSSGLALRPGGGMVVGGDRDGREIALLGVTSSGAPDPSFNGSIALAGFKTGRNGRLVELRVDPLGRAVVLTHLLEPNAMFSPMGEIGLVRLLASGARDAAFGVGGEVIGTLAPSAARGQANTANALAVQADGKVLVGGTAIVGSAQAAAVMRFNADGSVDTGFGNAGRYLLPNPTGKIGVEAMLAMADGTTLIAYRALTPPATGCCSNTLDTYVARLTASGTLDASFGANGVTHIQPSGSSLNADKTRMRLALQADGRIIVGGVDSQGLTAARLTATGQQDASFGAAGRAAFGGNHAALAVRADGGLTLTGYTVAGGFPDCSRFDNLPWLAVVRTNANGVIQAGTPGQGAVSDPLGATFPGIWATDLAGDGHMVGAGFRALSCISIFAIQAPPWPRGRAAVMRFSPGGALDATFGQEGIVDLGDNALTDNHARDVRVFADGSMLVGAENSQLGAPFTVYRLQGGGGGGPAPLPDDFDADGSTDSQDSSPLDARPTTQYSVTLTVGKQGGADGIVYSTQSTFGRFRSGTRVTFRAVAYPGSLFTGWSGACTGIGECTMLMDANKTLAATFVAQNPAPSLTIAPSPLAFGITSTSQATTRDVSATNTGTGDITISAVSTGTAAYPITHNCGLIAPGQSCLVRVMFSPTAAAAYPDTLTFQTSIGARTVALSGFGSLVRDYYNSILGRAPDPSGDAFWHSELRRTQGFGADVNEVWYLMAGYFFNSAEYLAAGKTDQQFVTDLYATFFKRTPDAEGNAYWTGQLASGLPREVVLFSFLFSNEFRAFTTGIYGSPNVRPEINLVTDLYRGFLNRLPDNDGFIQWRDKIKTAQCRGDAEVRSAVDSMSSGFLNGPEYGNRQRTNVQFVTDLYYAFLRRGGDKAGVDDWVSRLDTQQITRDGARQQFIASPEFSQRVNAIIAAGCAQ